MWSAALPALLLIALPAVAQSALDGRWIAEDPSTLGAAKIDPPPRISLVIRNERLAASVGCNQANAPVAHDGERLKLGLLVTTMRACPPELAQLERRYFGLLERNPSYLLEGDTLKLSLREDTVIFKRMPGPGAGAAKKFVYVAAERKDCVGVAPTQCLQVREEKTEPWRLYYGEIVGFTPEPGIEYRLRILDESVPNPPADAPSKRWYLDQVIEQRVVQPR